MALSDNLVSWWPLNEGSGNAADAHGGITLTDNNTVGAVTDWRDFESGSNQFFSVATNASVEAGDIEVSFQARIKLESAVNCIILSKDIDTPGSSRDYTLDINAGGARFYVNGGGGGLLVGSAVAIDPATEYNIFAGHSASANELWISVNAETPITATTGGTAPQVSSAPFHIGSRAYSGAEGYFDGLIRRVARWNRDIRADLSALHNSGAGLDYADVVGGAAGKSFFFWNLFGQQD